MRFRFEQDGAHSGERDARCDPPIVRCFWWENVGVYHQLVAKIGNTPKLALAA
jgi:hypothetical protein